MERDLHLAVVERNGLVTRLVVKTLQPALLLPLCVVFLYGEFTASERESFFVCLSSRIHQR